MSDNCEMSFKLICLSKNITTIYKNELFKNCDLSSQILDNNAEVPTIIYDSDNHIIKFNNMNKLDIFSIQIIDQNGRNIFSNQFNKEKKEVSIPNLVSGLYFITLSNENNIYYKKLRIH
jgi:hypothetical protein